MVFTSTRMHDEELQHLANGGWSSSMDKLARVLETGDALPQGFTIERTFKAPAEKVWAMWTTPEGIRKWWVPSMANIGYEMRVLEMDVRMGGKFAFELEQGPDARQPRHLHDRPTALGARLDLAFRYLPRAGGEAL